MSQEKILRDYPLPQVFVSPCVIRETTKRLLLSLVCDGLAEVLSSIDIAIVDDLYRPDQVNEAIQVFGADDPAHPSVIYLRKHVKEYYVGGKVQVIQPPVHVDYVALRCMSELFVIFNLVLRLTRYPC